MARDVVYIGDDFSSPLFVFQPEDIISISGLEDVDIINSTLPIGTCEIEVEITDEDEGDALVNVPYATLLWHYEDSHFRRRLYIKKTERFPDNIYKISCLNIIGILDQLYHYGGVYNGMTVLDLLTEMLLGQPYRDTISYGLGLDSLEVAETKICGWLPYDTIRANLQRIMFAENLILVPFMPDSETDPDYGLRGTLVLAYPDTNYIPISDNDIYFDGSVEYPDKISKVELVEHWFQRDKSGERVQLIDNSESTTADHSLYFFNNAPIDETSIVASEGLTVDEIHPNYIVITGNGTVTGIPYFDNSLSLVQMIDVNGESQTKSISDQYLVNPLNSENVIHRLVSYYTSAKYSKADIVLKDRLPGRTYQYKDSFGHIVQGYLASISYNTSAKVKASGKFVEGYSPEYHGNVYNYGIICREASYIDIPENTHRLHGYIIGGGDGGQSGLAGTVPNDPQEPGDGGEYGIGGYGGWIYEITLIDPEPGRWEFHPGVMGRGGESTQSTEEHNDGGIGEDSDLISPSGIVYSTSSDDSYRLLKGISYLFSGEVHASQGLDGVSGGRGGRGTSADKGDDGEDIVVDGVVVKGEHGSLPCNFDPFYTDTTFNIGGAGGNGASGDKIIDGGSYQAYCADYFTIDDSRGIVERNESFRAMPCITSKHSAEDSMKKRTGTGVGSGGAGGFGGYGCGGYGRIETTYYKDDSSSPLVTIYVRDAEDSGYVPYGNEWIRKSGNGYAGADGVIGGLILYSDLELTTEKIMFDPAIANATFEYYQSSSAPDNNTLRLFFNVPETNYPKYIRTYYKYEHVDYGKQGELIEIPPAARGYRIALSFSKVFHKNRRCLFRAEYIFPYSYANTKIYDSVNYVDILNGILQAPKIVSCTYVQRTSGTNILLDVTLTWERVLGSDCYTIYARQGYRQDGTWNPDFHQKKVLYPTDLTADTYTEVLTGVYQANNNAFIERGAWLQFCVKAWTKNGSSYASNYSNYKDIYIPGLRFNTRPKEDYIPK